MVKKIELTAIIFTCIKKRIRLSRAELMSYNLRSRKNVRVDLTNSESQDNLEECEKTALTAKSTKSRKKSDGGNVDANRVRSTRYSTRSKSKLSEFPRGFAPETKSVKRIAANPSKKKTRGTRTKVTRAKETRAKASPTESVYKTHDDEEDESDVAVDSQDEEEDVDGEDEEDNVASATDATSPQESDTSLRHSTTSPEQTTPEESASDSGLEDEETEYESESGDEESEEEESEEVDETPEETGEDDGDDEDEDDEDVDQSLADKIASRMRDRVKDIIEGELDGDYNGLLESPFLQGEWKNDVPELKSEEATKLDSDLKDILSEMRSDLPTIKDIIESDMTKNDKKECIYYLDLLKNADPYDPQFHDHRKFLQQKMKKKTKKQIELERLFRSEKSYESRILDLEADDEVKTTLLHYMSQISENDNDSEQRSKKAKMDAFLSLPYNKVVTPLFDKHSPEEFIKHAAAELDKELYGMTTVKRAFLSILSERINNLSDPATKNKGCAICLAGPPGVGKTHISSVFAKCLGLPFFQMTIGGAKDSTAIIGADNQWVGASCGQIARALQNMNCSNGVLFIDEIDKVSGNGLEIYDALNHVIDFTSNSQFEDVYFREIKLDLSRMWFVLSMNAKDILPSYLLDRLLVINVDPYETKEKFKIAKHFMLPKINSVSESKGVTFSDEAIKSVILMSEKDGVREISKFLKHICAKISMHILMKDSVKQFEHCEIKNFTIPYVITSSDVHELTNDIRSKCLSLTYTT